MDLGAKAIKILRPTSLAKNGNMFSTVCVRFVTWVNRRMPEMKKVVQNMNDSNPTTKFTSVEIMTHISAN